MYGRGCALRACVLAFVVLALRATPLFAQESSLLVVSSDARQPQGSPPSPVVQDPQMTREASGTSWLPDATPMYAIHWQRGPWQFMFHENAFLQSLTESSDRVAGQVGSINWAMGMAQRSAGSGRLMFRAMFSAEPWTI